MFGILAAVYCQNPAQSASRKSLLERAGWCLRSGETDVTVAACGSSSSHANKLSKADELEQQLQAAGGAQAYDAEMAPERDVRGGAQEHDKELAEIASERDARSGANGKQLAEIAPAREAECKRTVSSVPKLGLSATRSAGAR